MEFIGGLDPKLPTTFRITETAAAALAAMGLAVAYLWELRTRRRQTMRIDTSHATASLRSTKYLRLDGEKVSTERNTVMGIYPTKDDRWNYLHCNFPNHRAAALKVLGISEEREAVAEMVTQWDARELEEAIIAAGGAGAMVRSTTCRRSCGSAPTDGAAASRELGFLRNQSRIWLTACSNVLRGSEVDQSSVSRFVLVKSGIDRMVSKVKSALVAP